MGRWSCVSMIPVAVTLLCTMQSLGGAAQPSLATIIARAKPAVVFIVASTNSGAQSGTGFVVRSTDSSSQIITANHVIEGTNEVDVIFDSDERKRYRATVLQRDHTRDVAVLSVAVGHRRVLELERPRDIEEGMSIALVGYPLATLEFHRIAGDALRPSVHAGIVSAIRFNGEVVQFDAAAYHGDSGGPVLDSANGRVVAIVHGTELDPHYAEAGLEQSLPGSAFGPSAGTIEDVLNSSAQSSSPVATKSTVGLDTGSFASTSASYRVGYGVPHETITSGSVELGNQVNQAVESSALDRLTTFLRGDNSLYLVPVAISLDALGNSEKLSGYCDDARLNVLAAPSYSWNLTGGPRYNGYGTLVGYSGTATVAVYLFVFDCYGEPFFVEQKSKSENRYFAHRTPDREVVDMANDLLDQLMTDFSSSRSGKAAEWDNLLKTGIAIDPSSTKLYPMMFLTKKPEGYQVYVVVPGGPADRAGVRPQDIIEQVNGDDASALSFDQLAEMMNRRSFTLTLQRPGGTIDVSVYPKAYDDVVQMIRH
jgi:S1-C subfamily serine protease